MTVHHVFRNIYGWFDFDDLYLAAIARAPADEPSTFVELGTWLGRSLSFLAVEVVNSQKPIELVSIDRTTNVEIDPSDQMQVEMRRLWQGRLLIDVLAHHLGACLDAGLLWTHLVHDTSEAAKNFVDASVDFVFVDADHSYEGVLKDLRAWWPKVKAGGRMAGHDHTLAFPGVIQAVAEFFDGKALRSASSWYIDK